MQYSVVNYESIGDASHSLRLDGEFFRPDYLQVQHQLETDEQTAIDWLEAVSQGTDA